MESGRLAGEPFTRLIAADDQDINYLFHKKLFETGAPQASELRMARPDGVLFPVRLEATVGADAISGELICHAVMMSPPPNRFP